jgi:hypothetical protein
MSADEKRIRDFAYQIWESEGQPEGQEERHWEMARKLAEAEALAPDKKDVRKTAKPKLPKVDGAGDAKPVASKAAAKPAVKPATKPAAKPPVAKAATKPAAKAAPTPVSAPVAPPVTPSAKKARAPRKPSAT